jgi:ADP-ribose pyrophosphatase
MPQELNSCPVQKSSEKILFDGFLTLKEEMIETAHGPIPYYTVHTTPASVMILPFRQDGTIMMVREWRYAVKEFVHSFPGGLVDKEESPLVAAERELLEETGYKGSSYKIVGSCFPLPGLLSQRMWVVMARDVIQVQDPCFEPLESLTISFLTLEAMKHQIRTSLHLDAMALASLSLFSNSF